jgi:divalent metal cation (Fe/Co/Zn/Cd) transporter
VDNICEVKPLVPEPNAAAHNINVAVRADAAESAVCSYLALIALAGLVVNAVWKVRWADPVAALALLPLLIREGLEAWKGKACRH